MKQRGMALFTVLVMCSVLFMMLITLYLSARGSLFTSLTHQRGIVNYYVAQAGLADTMGYLEDHSMVSPPGSFSATLPAGGTWTVHFANASPGLLDSVNNLANANGPADSYRGPGTVPPNSALIVVQANIGGQTRVLEAIVSRGGGTMKLENALQAGGKLLMKDEILVDGSKALDDPAEANANIYSNSGASDSTRWIPAGGSISIHGTSSAVGSSDLNGYLPVGGILNSAAPAPFPSVNILNTIASKASKPAPTLVSGGITSLPAGDYYYNGDLNLVGDIQLNGAALYVNGKVNIDGTIRGKGAVYVAGSTKLNGDADVTADNSQKVALFSQGDVSLEGYDGSKLLDTLAASDTTINNLWTEARADVKKINEVLVTHSSNAAAINSDSTAHATINDLEGALGRVPSAAPVRQQLVLPSLISALGSQPASPSRDFVIRRLNKLADRYSYGQAFPGNDAQVLIDYQASNHQNLAGLLDAACDQQDQAAFQAAARASINSNFNKLGQAQFVGMVYTAGNLTVKNDLSVSGAVISRGDMTLNSGASVFYIENFFNQPNSFALSGNDLWVETCLAR